MHFSHMKSPESLQTCIMALQRIEFGPDIAIVQAQLQQAQKSYDIDSNCSAEVLLSLKLQHVGEAERIRKLNAFFHWTEARLFPHLVADQEIHPRIADGILLPPI